MKLLMNLKALHDLLFNLINFRDSKMLGRIAPGVAQVTVMVNQQQSRNMATLKAISMRLKSVKNIQKITQSMKMVSAAK